MRSVTGSRLQSINQAAMHLGLSRATIYRLHSRGALPFVKLAGRTLVDEADIEALIQTGKKAAA
jgi:excisionase family DNA binding protein